VHEFLDQIGLMIDPRPEREPRPPHPPRDRRRAPGSRPGAGPA
jgi:hypothetical protein